MLGIDPLVVENWYQISRKDFLASNVREEGGGRREEGGGRREEGGGRREE
jgi:hypothetical protein